MNQSVGMLVQVNDSSCKKHNPVSYLRAKCMLSAKEKKKQEQESLF